MQCPHQHFGRDSTKMRDGEKTITKRYCPRGTSRYYWIVYSLKYGAIKRWCASRNKKQYEEETIHKFLDELEMLRDTQSDESNSRMNLAELSFKIHWRCEKGVSFLNSRAIWNWIVHSFEMPWRRLEEALSGVKASQARLMTEAEARRKRSFTNWPRELASRTGHEKNQAIVEDSSGRKLETVAQSFRIDYKAAARDALNWIQQELATREIELKA